MKWIVLSLAGFLVVVLVAVVLWYGDAPTTELVDATGKELTAGDRPTAAVDTPAADPLFGSVHARIAAREFTAAKEELLRILEDADRDGEACILLCDVTRELGETDETVDYGLKAVELLPDSAPAHLAYARALGHKLATENVGLTNIFGALKGVKRFKAEAERVIELDPTDTFARMMLVFTNLAPAPIGNVDRALKIAEEIEPHDPILGKRLRALCHHQKGETERAIELCREGMREHPTAGYFHTTLADIYVDQERFAEADTEYEAARTGDRDEAYFYSLYFQARMRTVHEFDPAPAVALLDKYVAAAPHYEGLPTIGQALWRKGVAQQLLGRLDDARATWRECLRHDPKNERAKDSLEEVGE